MNTENLWKTGGMMPPGPTRMEGEEDVLSPAVDHSSGPAAWMYKQNLDGHRDLEAAICAYYGGVCPSRRGWMLQQFIMPDTVHHAYSGATVTRDYSMHSDLYRPAEVKLEWKLLAPGGTPVAGASGTDSADMTSGGVKRGTIKFAAPDVHESTKYTLDVRMYSDDKFAYGEQREIEVWPKPNDHRASKSACNIIVFDPSGKTAAAIQSVCGEFQTVKSLGDVEDQPRMSILVIGEDALTETNAADVAKLDKFVSDGNYVVILAQKVTPVGLPIATSIEPKLWASQVFVECPMHPVFDAFFMFRDYVKTWDLHFWAPDRVVARGAYTKPDRGPFTVLADSGGATGMEWAQMMECYRGKGSYVLCQLPLVSKIDQEPTARLLLFKMLREMYRRRNPTGTLKVLAAPGSLVDKRLHEVGVKTQAIVDTEAPREGGVTLIDASHKDAATVASKIGPSLVLGTATIVVVGATPADEKWLSDLAGQPVKITIQPYRMWEGRGYRTCYNPLTAGLTQLDLYWKTYDGSEAAGSQAENAQYAIEPLNDYSVSVSSVGQASGLSGPSATGETPVLQNARELVFPGAAGRTPGRQGPPHPRPAPLDDAQRAAPEARLPQRHRAGIGPWRRGRAGRARPRAAAERDVQDHRPVRLRQSLHDRQDARRRQGRLAGPGRPLRRPRLPHRLSELPGRALRHRQRQQDRRRAAQRRTPVPRELPH